MGAHVYMLRCRDGSFYVGLTSEADLAIRLYQHQSGVFPGSYTHSRRPVTLVWSDYFPHIDEAIEVERQLKGWRRAKKEALIRGDWGLVSRLQNVAAGNQRPRPESRTPIRHPEVRAQRASKGDGHDDAPSPLWHGLGRSSFEARAGEIQRLRESPWPRGHLRMTGVGSAARRRA
jgi:putative endonuclease